MASKKVIVNIKVNQDGAKVSDVTKDVKKLTDAEKERIKVRNELKKTDAQIEIVNEDITKTLKERKSVLKDLASQQLTSSQIAKIAAKKKKEDTEEQIRIEKKAFNEKKRIESNGASIDRQRSRALIAQFNAQEKLTQKTIESAQAQELLNKNLQQFKTTSGLSGAIVTEFGRTVSDLPFGIRGVGNNLAQLGSLFGSLAVNAKKAGGGIKDAIGQILVSFKGIVGFITVFQVFIALLQTEFFQKFLSGLAKSIGALDLFKGKLDVLNDVFEEASEIAGNSVAAFKRYTDVLKDSASSTDQKRIALEKLNEEFPDYNASLLLAEGNTKKSTEANDEYIRSLVRKAKATAAQSKLNEIESEKFKFILEAEKKELEANDDFESDLDVKRLKRLEEVEKKRAEFEKIGGQAAIDAARRYGESNKLFQEFNNREGGSLLEGQLFRARSGAGEAKEALSKELKDIADDLADELKEFEPDETILQKFIGDLEGGNSSGNSGGVNSSERRVKRFKEFRLSLEQELNRSQDDLKKTTFRTNKEILEDEGENAEKSIKIKTDEFIRKEELRLKDFIKQKKLDLKRKGITENESNLIKKSISEAEALSAKTITSAEKESQAVISSISNVTQARIDNREKLDRFLQEKASFSVDESNLREGQSFLSEGVDKAEAERELNQRIFDEKLALADQELALLTTTEDRKREILAEKRIIESEARKQDVEDEKNIINEKYNIQEQYISYLSGLSGILGGISNKNKEFQKVQLIAEKGAAIASVVTSAAKSIGTQTADKSAADLSAARNWQLAGGLLNPLATSAYVGSKTANAAAYKKGVFSTKAGAALAIGGITSGAISGLSAISNSGGGDSGAGSAGGSPQQAPDFNIIGSTGVNQLADAIGGTTGQSVKAYVVSSDITNQQALDRSINESAQI